MRVVFLFRGADVDKAYEWTEPFSRQVAEDALDRLYATPDLLIDLGVDDNPAL